MNKLSLILLSCLLILTLSISISAKRSKKRSFIEEIVELADSERGSSFAPMRMSSFSAPRIHSFSAPSMPRIHSFSAPKMPTFTSFAPSYRAPSFAPSFAPMRMPSFVPMRMPSYAAPRIPSFTPMRMPSAAASYSPMRFAAPRVNSFAHRLPAFVSPRMPIYSPRNPSFGNFQKPTPGWGRMNLRNYAARGPSFTKPIGWGRVNLNNYANRVNRSPFGSLPSRFAPVVNNQKQPGWGRMRFMNYANRFNGKNPFGSLPNAAPRQFNQRLPFFAQNKFGKGPISSNHRIPASKLPFFARDSSFKGRPLMNRQVINPNPSAPRSEVQKGPKQTLSQLMKEYNLGSNMRPETRGIDRGNARGNVLAKQIEKQLAGQLSADPATRTAQIAYAMANDKPKGKCAGYVAGSIEAGLGKAMQRPAATVHVKEGIPSAKDYGPSLQKLGYNQIANTAQAKIGDVQVIPGVPGHKDGHIQIYTAKGWVSDFNQGISSTLNPKSAYFGQTPTTYRLP